MGQVRKDTNQQIAAKLRVAERRRCPKCGRKSALKRLPIDLDRGLLGVTYCRWEDCDYERHHEPHD